MDMNDFPVVALRSVELGTPDLAGSVDFYTRVWGLEKVAEVGDKVFLAATGDDCHVLELKQSDRSELRKSPSAPLRGGSRRTVRKDGGLRLHGAARTGRRRSVDRRAQVRHPRTAGFGSGIRAWRPRRQANVVPNRVLRLAHVNINSADIEALSDFYRTVLGFRLTDRSKMMAFLSCNSDHHAVVLAEAAAHGLNHIAFLMPDLESVMRGSGLVVDQGFPIGWGVGRHGPGDNVFAYFVDPMGVVIEYTAEVLQVDATYRVKGPDEWVWPPGRTDHWGIAPPKSDACKKAQISIGFSGA